MPRVLNYKRDGWPEGAVNIMRPTKWGNPFPLYRFPRAEGLKMYETHILPHLDVSELKGKDLVCCCDPLPCHGHLLLRKANGVE